MHANENDIQRRAAAIRMVLLDEVIVNELDEIRERYGDDRRTEIVEAEGDLSIEDLVPNEEVVVTGIGGAAFDIRSTAPGGTVTIRDLVIEGQAGVISSVASRLENVTFRSIAGRRWIVPGSIGSSCTGPPPGSSGRRGPGPSP